MTGETIRSFDGEPSTPTPLPAETPFSIPRTVPADPREALARLIQRVERHVDFECGRDGRYAFMEDVRLIAGDLAARQDEPSPALRDSLTAERDELRSLVEDAIGRFRQARRENTALWFENALARAALSEGGSK